MREVMLERVGIDFLGEDREAATLQMKEALEERIHPATSWAELVLAVYSKLIEPHINQPTHVFDFPLEPFPITKRHAEHPELAEHFDAVIGGVEPRQRGHRAERPGRPVAALRRPAQAADGRRRGRAAPQRRGVRARDRVRLLADRRRRYGRGPA